MGARSNNLNDDSMNKDFKDHPMYGEYFSVSDSGEIFSKRTHKILKTQVSKKGYRVFTTRFDGRNGKSKLFFVHKLVAEAWIENPENKPEVNHKDGNKLNNHISNLEWVSHSENIQHAYNTGLMVKKRGCESPSSKLSDNDICEIRKNILGLSNRKLSKKYNVSHYTISQVRNYKSYKNT